MKSLLEIGNTRAHGERVTREEVVSESARAEHQQALLENGHRREDRRESGEPGGGAGRTDEVRGSGVYPMSGPHPAGNAEIKGQASWGQGERGAAGYEDHGGSQLSYEGGQLLGGLSAGPGGEPEPSSEHNADEEIAREQWMPFLDSFSRQHMDWLATIEIVNPEGHAVLVRERRLKGVSFDQSTEGRAYIEMGEDPAEHVTHVISQPTRLIFKRMPSGAHEGLEIASADGAITTIRFRATIEPEMLDGIAS